MSNQPTILNAFWQIADILRQTLPFHEISDLPASFFFLKRTTDSVKVYENQIWLSSYSGVPIELAGFTWKELSNCKKPNETLLWLLRKIEKSIPPLSGLSERSSLAYLTRSEHALEIQLHEIFNLLSTVSLEALSCDEASEIFQQLLDGMADRVAGSSVTPVSVRKLLIELVRPQPGDRIYDPVCGYASLLCEAARAGKLNCAPSYIYGQDLQPGVALTAKMNALLGNWEFDIHIGDTIALPHHLIGDKLQKFDVVLANPPFGLRIQKNIVKNDRFGRFETAQPLCLEVGIIQHISKSLADGGRAAVLVPNGFLFRGGSDYYVRKELVDNDRIRAIIALPSHLFAKTAIAASVLVLNGPKIDGSKQRTIFVDLRAFAEGQKTRQRLNEIGIATAVNCIVEPLDRDEVSAVVSKNEMIANNYDLAVSGYVRIKAKNERSFEDELRLFISSIEKRNQAEQIALSLLSSIIINSDERCND